MVRRVKLPVRLIDAPAPCCACSAWRPPRPRMWTCASQARQLLHVHSCCSQRKCVV